MISRVSKCATFAGCQHKVMVDEFPQAQVPGEGGRQEQAGIGHQAMVVKEDAATGEFVLWQRLCAFNRL